MFNNSLFISLSQYGAIPLWAIYYKEKQCEVLRSYFYQNAKKDIQISVPESLSLVILTKVMCSKRVCFLNWLILENSRHTFSRSIVLRKLIGGSIFKFSNHGTCVKQKQYYKIFVFKYHASFVALLVRLTILTLDNPSRLNI